MKGWGGAGQSLRSAGRRGVFGVCFRKVLGFRVATPQVVTARGARVGTAVAAGHTHTARGRGACGRWAVRRVVGGQRRATGVPCPSPSLRRHSVGFPGRGRDQEEPGSVHLSGGTPERVVSLYSPCPPGTLRPAPNTSEAHRAQKKPPMHQPTPPSAADDRPGSGVPESSPSRGTGPLPYTRTGHPEQPGNASRADRTSRRPAEALAPGQIRRPPPSSPPSPLQSSSHSPPRPAVRSNYLPRTPP
jgi:hypothetical protein